MTQIRTIKLDSFETKDVKDSHINGKLTLIWRDYDKLIDFSPKMIYLTSVKSGEIKGPHLHTKRDSYFVCIRGKVIFIIKNENDEFIEIELNSDEPQLLFIPKDTASAHINKEENIGRILTLADISWKPDDNEMKNVDFDNYDWKKWF